MNLRAITSITLAAALGLAFAPAEILNSVGGSSAAALGAPRVAAAPAGEWVAGDLHVHSTYSHDSFNPLGDDNTEPDEFYVAGASVEQQFRQAQARGLDFLAITDHNDVRSQGDVGFGRFGVIGLPAYENSMDGHSQMLGATEVYEDTHQTLAGTQAEADALRADGGVFQINHPADPLESPEVMDWGHGYDVVPDSVETWNVTTVYQPPFPAASNNDDNITYWEGWLDRGVRVAATGASDTHWLSTSAVQGPGQPTTWVYVTDRSADGILAGLRAGRTTISSQPPSLGSARVFLEADGDGDGVWESMVGDTVPTGAALRVRAEGVAGGTLKLFTDGGTPFGGEIAITGERFTHTFVAPAGSTWVRAELFHEDATEERAASCDAVVGSGTTYCRNRIARAAMTSALFLDDSAPLTTTAPYAALDGSEALIGNGVVERRFATDGFGTTSFTDLRSGFATGATDDLRLTTLDGVEITGADLTVTDATSRTTADGGLALMLRLEPLAAAAAATGVGHVERTYTVYPEVAGVRVQTTVALPGVYTGYTLDELAMPGAAPTAQHFNAGYDWRGSDTPDWEPAAAPFGGAHTGDHRVTTAGAAGEPIDVTGQWLTLDADADDAGAPRATIVLERVNYDSSHVAFDGTVGRAHVALADDLIYLGPFEGEVHADNPTPAPVRARTVAPGQPLVLESVFTSLALDADDEPWQHHQYLARHRGADWARDVTFNTNGVDKGRISTGAKDDMDFAEVQRQAAVAKRLGVERFILDDGWQAASGDWCPDSAACPEPRGLYPDRFPDDTFEAVRAELGAMEFGLWMSPMHFNPASSAFRENPTWACSPVGDGLAAYNTVEPDGGSNEAGLGEWNPEAISTEGRLIDFIEGRIRRQVEVYGATYFKFDFLAWLDCVDDDVTTAYDYRESFIAMNDSR